MADPKKLSLLSSAADVEKRFLAGPRDRAKDLESAIRYFLEFLRGFETLGAIDRPCVTVFGSARLGEGTPYYDMARALGRRLAEEGLAAQRMTGHSHSVGAALMMLGEIALREGDQAGAAGYFGEALALYDALGHERFAAEARSYLDGGRAEGNE